MVDALMEKLDRLPFDWSPATRAASEEICRMGSVTEAPELERWVYQPGGSIVEVEQDGLSRYLAHSGTNFEFVQGRAYPEEERVDNPEVVLQVDFDPDEGYQARVYLHGEGIPTRDIRERIVAGEVLDYYRPRREDDHYFLRETETKALWTERLEQDDFREAVQEALRVCVLTEWE